MTIRLRGDRPIELGTTKNYLSMSNRNLNMDRGLFNDNSLNFNNFGINSNSDNCAASSLGGNTASCGNSLNCVA